MEYTDVFIQPMNTKLPDGTRVGCKRKGLKLMLTAGARKGEGLICRLDVGKDPVVKLNAALQGAAKAAVVELKPRTPKSRFLPEHSSYSPRFQFPRLIHWPLPAERR